MEFIDGNRIKVDPPKKPKKLTATRFATILGLNAWQTPFEVDDAILAEHYAHLVDKPFFGILRDSMKRTPGCPIP